MSDKGSVFQKGGGGTNFEQSVQTAFLTTLIVSGQVPCLASCELREVAFQVTNRGYQTDDLLAIACSQDSQHRLLIQVKHNISFTADNLIFKDVVDSFWKDYKNTAIFDKAKDKFIIVKSGLTKDERNHLKSLFNWATNHATEADFILEVNRIKGKKERLDTFREVLKQANNNVDLTNEELWQFLKCMDILEYDFLNQGSVDQTYFLNLIKLCKSKQSTATDKEIWDSLFSYAAILNKDGGSATIESIKSQSFFRHFDSAQIAPCFKAVEKLRSDGEAILRPIKVSIGKAGKEFQLLRTEVRESLINAINSSQMTIVTGKPGVGKSAKIKESILRDFHNASTFVFRADQFTEPTIANVLSSQGINETIQDIFSSIALIPEKIIFIDSLEKLLEADPECAFKQFLALLQLHPDIKVIASIRKYAIDLVAIKFGIDKNKIRIIDIPILSDDELILVSAQFPQLQSVLKNERIKKLLKSPKYLDFLLLAIDKTKEDFSNISQVEFKDKLWNALVVDSTTTKNGLPIKREAAFMEIAVKRAREMKLFTAPDKSDAEAVAYLENDEIIFQENQNRKYSPAHDILEDWALVKYVSRVFEDNPKPKVLFSKLGTEPAIRRAFRLWVDDYLIENGTKINDLIRLTIPDQTIGKYWADELMISVFKSENSNSFFMTFEKELLDNNASLFNRCLHIIKTCCKESDPLANKSNLLLPIGSAWQEALFFVQKHIVQLEPIKLSILNLLADWYNRSLFQYDSISNAELASAKFIVQFYIKQAEDENEFWQKDAAKKMFEDLISILFELAAIARDEITQLLMRALSYVENPDSWKLNSLYKSIIKLSLSGIGNYRLIQELPELIIEVASKDWKYSKPKESENVDDVYGFLGRHSLRDEECWGIKDKHSFFPSGIYKTPAYNLLQIHPINGIRFIVSFINYSVDFYTKAECEYKHQVTQIEIQLNDGTVVKQWAAWELWAAYRGISVTNYALESLLKSLEKYLLEMANLKTEVSKKNLKFVFNYLLRQSNNVAISSVLSSVAMAYPEVAEEEMLPLLGVKEFYEWDISRAVKEHMALAVNDNHIAFAQEETANSNKLPHRKQYNRGLADFIINYQFNIRKLNPQIHQIFDRLLSRAKDDEVSWRKLLSEIDARKWEVTPYDEKVGGFVVQPKYEKDVAEYIASNQDFVESQNAAATYSGLISKAYEKKSPLSYKKWKECQKYYSNPENLDFLYSRPVMLAILGLTEFSNDISKAQKNWCLEILLQSIIAILKDALNGSYPISKGFNLMEKGIALSSCHLLMLNANDDNDKSEIISLMIYMLIAPFADHEVENIAQYVREEFYNLFPGEGKRIWIGLIKYSKYRKSNPQRHRHQDEQKIKNDKENEVKFVEEVSTEKEPKLNISEISLETCEAYILARALTITPYNTTDDEFSDFIKLTIPIVLNDLTRDEDSSYNSRRESRKFHHESLSAIEKYIANLLLNARPELSQPVLTLLVESLPNATIKYRNDLFEFVSTCLDYFVLKLYDNGNLQINNNQYSEQLSNFWRLWEILFDLIPSDGNHPLIPKLLLDIRFLLWDSRGYPIENNWGALNGKKEFYRKMLLEKGKLNVSSAINMFSTIGLREFLPDGISWLVEIFKSDEVSSLALTSPSAKRMIKRLFFDFISKIKNDKILIDDYVWVLDKMVDLGSSDAYLIRENVITYKTYDN